MKPVESTINTILARSNFDRTKTTDHVLARSNFDQTKTTDNVDNYDRYTEEPQ